MKMAPLKPKWLVLDIDGVLTDGSDTVPPGEKRLFLRDLDALTRARREGIGVAFLTGESEAVAGPVVERCGGGPALYETKDKVEGMRRLVGQLGCSLSEVCYVADGERDAPALELVGLALSPCDASAAARAVADRVLVSAGGRGAVEEVVAMICPVAGRSGDELADSVRGELNAAANAMGTLAESGVETLVRVVEVMTGSLAAGGTVFLFGNGGSAAIAQHAAAELVGRYRRKRGALPAVALTADTALLTALANDFGYENIFGRQVEALARWGDVAVGMSTSGLSDNVARGLAAARRMGSRTIALVGADPGAVGAQAEFCLTFPAPDTARVQELHLTALHAVCSCLDHLLPVEPALRDRRP